MKTSPDFHAVLTCIGPNITALFYESLMPLLSKRKIVCGRTEILAQKEIDCVAISLSSKRNFKPRVLMKALTPLSERFGVDLVVQPADLYALEKRLVVFDLESTLIQAEVLDELAKERGIGEKIARITKRAMNGEIKFPDALRERVFLLRGLPERRLAHLYKRIRFTPGAVPLIAALRKKGYKTAIITGGFDYFAERYKKKLRVDYAFSNRLEIKKGRITGYVLDPIIDGMKKASLLKEIVRAEGIKLDQVVAIGDGANDLPMMTQAGLGIAWNAKPAVRKAAPCQINQSSMLCILYLLGFSEREI